MARLRQCENFLVSLLVDWQCVSVSIGHVLGFDPGSLGPDGPGLESMFVTKLGLRSRPLVFGLTLAVPLAATTFLGQRLQAFASCSHLASGTVLLRSDAPGSWPARGLGPASGTQPARWWMSGESLSSTCTRSFVVTVLPGVLASAPSPSMSLRAGLQLLGVAATWRLWTWPDPCRPLSNFDHCS